MTSYIKLSFCVLLMTVLFTMTGCSDGSEAAKRPGPLTKTVRNHAGTYLQSVTYEVSLKIKIVPPSTDDKIIVNPGHLGD